MVRLIPLLLLLACTGSDKNPGDDSGGGPEPGIVALDPTATVSPAISTVLTVEWTTSEAGTSYVEYGPTDRYGYTTQDDGQTSTDHRVVVAGFPTNAEWHWRAVSEIGGEKYVSEDQIFETGAGDPGLPDFDLQESVDGAHFEGFRLFTAFGTDAWVLIANDDGRIVWWEQLEGDRALATQARLTNNGSAVAYLTGDRDREEDIAEIVTISLDKSEETRVRVEWGHHDFIEIPGEDKWAYFAIDFRNYQGDYVAGDSVVEVSKDGSSSEVIWNSWDTLEPEYNPMATEFYPGAVDWTHCNNLILDGSDYYVSLHNNSGVAKVARATGDIDWVVGGGYSDFQWRGRDEEFIHQHGFKLVAPDEFILFDNGGDSPDDVSAVSGYRINQGAGTYERTWEWDHDGRHKSYLLGDIHLLPSGNYLTAWGSEGEITEITPEYDIVWQFSASIGYTVGFLNPHEQIGGSLR